MIKDRIYDIVKKAIEEVGYSSEKFTLTKSTRPEFGDFATSIAMVLAKELKKDPFEIAGEIAQVIPIIDPVGSVKIIRPGFINVSLSPNYLLEELDEIIDKKEIYGTTPINEEKKVIVEYSSPNIAKPFTIGHLRSTIIGDAIANLLEATGHRVYRDNHVGDWGTQFGKQIYAIQKWGDLSVIEQSEHPVKELVALYVKFHEEAEKDPTLEDQARAIFKKLEEHDPEITKLWKMCIDWSFREFDRIYEELGVHFTENHGHGYGESFFEDKMQDIINELEKTDFYQESKDAKLVFFPDDKLPPLMIIKQDGASLYATRDLATDKFRLTNEKYKPLIKIINEVGAEQSLYFQQLYETEKMLGWVKDGQRVHVKHGLYRFKDMKMSTRKGNTIWLEDVLKEAEDRASEINKTDESE
jgi:arginyl-tRNA synthetase